MLFVGVDIQTKRGCPYAAINSQGRPIESGWIEDGPANKVARQLDRAIRSLASENEEVAVGLDAPRIPLARPRNWYWRRNRWRSRESKDQGYGRHCEVVIAAHRLANPQWTRTRETSPEWMQLGFSLFEHLDEQFDVYEVFPSASYTMLDTDESFTIELGLAGFARSPKDMLDAYVAAVTVREFTQGRGTEIGGGDGLGTIVLPRRIEKPIEDVLKWPG